MVNEASTEVVAIRFSIGLIVFTSKLFNSGSELSSLYYAQDVPF